MRYTVIMANKLVYLNWDPDEQFILHDRDAFQVVMKKPKGVSASDLLPMALIGCASHDVVEILNKQKQNLRELKVTAESTAAVSQDSRVRVRSSAEIRGTQSQLPRFSLKSTLAGCAPFPDPMFANGFE